MKSRRGWLCFFFCIFLLVSFRLVKNERTVGACSAGDFGMSLLGRKSGFTKSTLAHSKGYYTLIIIFSGTVGVLMITGFRETVAR